MFKNKLTNVLSRYAIQSNILYNHKTSFTFLFFLSNKSYEYLVYVRMSNFAFV